MLLKRGSNQVANGLKNSNNKNGGSAELDANDKFSKPLEENQGPVNDKGNAKYISESPGSESAEKDLSLIHI